MGNCCSSLIAIVYPNEQQQYTRVPDGADISPTKPTTLMSGGGGSGGGGGGYQQSQSVTTLRSTTQPPSAPQPSKPTAATLQAPVPMPTSFSASSSSSTASSKTVEIAPKTTKASPTTAISFGGEGDNSRPISPFGQPGKSAFHQSYELRDEIGVGSTSKCYRCLRKSDGKEFACKVIDKRQVELKFSVQLEQFYVEIKVLQALNHPNIILLEDTFESADRIYMVMELMKGGELFDYVVEKGTLSEEEASVILRKITSAVAHMHSQGVIHRDLKPENLLLTGKGSDAEIKLIDFGLAKVISDDVASSFLGTKGYLAPEMLQRLSYDKAIDMWALGVIAFVLLCGCLPFDDDSSRIASESQARKKFNLRFPKWASSLSASAKDLLHNLLEIDPKRRYTADQALNHPWVSGKTVQLNNFLLSPNYLGARRKEQQSPLPPNYIQNTYDRMQGGAATTARVTYATQPAPYANMGTGAHASRRAANPPPAFDFGAPSAGNGRVRKNSF